MTILFFNYYWDVKGAQLRYFQLFWICTETPLNDRKPENIIVLRCRKKRKMAKNGEDKHRLQKTNLNNLDKSRTTNSFNQLI